MAWDERSAARGGAIGDEELRRVMRGAAGIAARWVRRMPSWMDGDAFFGEAMLAVALAIPRYRAGRGPTFETYAWLGVRKALAAEARRQDPAGRYRRGRIRRGQSAPTAADGPPASLDALAAAGWEPACADPAPGPEARALATEGRRRLAEAIALLPRRQALVLHLRYWEGLSCAETARRLGVTRQRVCQVEQGGLERLRAELGPGFRLT